MDINATTNINTINLTEQSEQIKCNSSIKITESLPNEVLHNIFSRLEIFDLHNCKPICKRFLIIANDVENKHFTSLPTLKKPPILLKKHPMLSVDYYKSVTRSWLQAINMPDTKISYLDKRLDYATFSFLLFFAIIEHLDNKENIEYKKETTLVHNLGQGTQDNACTISCYLSPAANVIVSLFQNDAKVWRLSANNWLLEDTLNNYDESEAICIKDICFSPDGCFIVTVSNFEFKIWSYVDGHWQANSSFERLQHDKLYFMPNSKRFVIITYPPEIYDLIDDKWQLVTDNVLDIDNLNNIDPDACDSTTPYIKNNTKTDHWLQAILQTYMIYEFQSSYLFQPFGDRIMTLLHDNWKTWSNPESEHSGVNYSCTSFDMTLFMMSGYSHYRGRFTIIYELIDNKWQEKIIIKGETKWACFSLDNKKVILFQEHIIEGSTNYTTQQKSIVCNITKSGLIKALDLDYASNIIFSADSKYIANSLDTKVQIWQETTNNQQPDEQQLINSWQLITTIENDVRVVSINFSLDKRLLIIMLKNGEINIHQLK